MPIVGVDTEQYERNELASAPANPDDPNDEVGYVMLRPLPYGVKLARRSKATKMMMRSQPAQSRKQAQAQEQVFEFESHDEWAVAHDFSHCIGEHNLFLAPGQKCDFSTIAKAGLAIRKLDPRVGTEIERLIDALNNDEDEESMEDFLQRRNTSLKDEVNLSLVDGDEDTEQAENS